MDLKDQTSDARPAGQRSPCLASGSSGRRIATVSLTLIALGSLIGIIVPAGSGWDFANFYDAGRRAAAGDLADLYQAGAPIDGGSAAGDMMFWGAPVSSYLYAPLSVFSLDAALIAFKISNVLALYAALATLLFFYRRFTPDREVFTVLFIVAALLFQPFWTIFRVGGQSTPFAFLLLCCALVTHPRERFFVSWACFAGAVMIKPILGPGLIFLLAFSGRRAFLAAIPVGIAFAAVSLLSTSWATHVEFLERLSSGGDFMRDWWFNSAVAQPFFYVPALVGADPGEGPHLLYRIMRWICAGAVLATTIRLVAGGVGRRLPTPAMLHLACLTALTLPVLIVPIAWEHYLAFLFPLFIFVLAGRPGMGGAATTLVAVAVVLALGQNLIFIMAVGEVVGWNRGVLGLTLSILKSAPAWLAIWLMWRHRDELLDAHSALAARVLS